MWSVLLIFLSFGAQSYNGRVLVVSGERAVIAVPASKAQVGDELVFYDKQLVQLGTAKINRFGKKRSRAVVKIPQGMELKRGYTLELLEASGPVKSDLTSSQMMRMCVDFKKKEPVSENWELFLDGQSLKLLKSEKTTGAQIGFRLSYLFLPGFQLGVLVDSVSVDLPDRRQIFAAGLVLSHPLREESAVNAYFGGAYLGSAKIAGQSFSYSEFLLGRRFRLIDYISWTPHIRHRMIGKRAETEVSLISISMLF